MSPSTTKNTTSSEYISVERQEAGKEVKPPEPIQLCQFLSAEAKSPLACIKRTARYAEDPKTFLKSVLGEEAFGQRQAQLCIPDEIDRDFYGTGKHKQHFERHIANLLGKKYGLFFITGVQAQLIAINIHCKQIGNYRVAWHVSSHLESAEEQAYKTLYGLNRILLGDLSNENPSVEEIRKVLSRPEACRPAVILLEIPNRTLGCATYSFEDLQTISDECRKANVRLHCDGARLWEIEPYYQATAGKSFKDIGALFDSVYVSFYKGLQGSSGAMLSSNDADVIRSAKTWQRRAGGNVFTLQYQVIDAERGYNENIGTFAAKREKMIEVTREIRKATLQYRNKDGTPFVQFVPDGVTCCQIHTLFWGFSADELTAARDRVEEQAKIRVFERLGPKKTVDELLEEERAAEGSEEKTKVRRNAGNQVVDTAHITEWMIVEATQRIHTKIFVDGYVALCEALQSRRSSRRPRI